MQITQFTNLNKTRSHSGISLGYSILHSAYSIWRDGDFSVTVPVYHGYGCRYVSWSWLTTLMVYFLMYTMILAVFLFRRIQTAFLPMLTFFLLMKTYVRPSRPPQTSNFYRKRREILSLARNYMHAHTGDFYRKRREILSLARNCIHVHTSNFYRKRFIGDVCPAWEKDFHTPHTSDFCRKR